MQEGTRPGLDVVIPVYNAPEATRRCIDSLYRFAEASFDRLIVHDDASDAETRRMLDSLRHPRLEVIRSATNMGFGQGVNHAVRAASAPLVLVLNSDTQADHDFVAPLRRAMEASPALGALSPSGPSLASYDLARCVKREGCVVTYSLLGYAFAVRRAVFLELGGFDPVFGRGYYEDLDLARRMLDAGWWLGVHPEARLHHSSHGSFGDREVRELLERNARIYFERYPAARRVVLLLGGRGELSTLPSELVKAAERILRKGGVVRWLSRPAPRELLSLRMRGATAHLGRTLRLLWKRRRRDYRRFTDVWLIPPVTRPQRWLVPRVAKRLGARIRTFDAEVPIQ